MPICCLQMAYALKLFAEDIPTCAASQGAQHEDGEGCNAPWAYTPAWRVGIWPVTGAWRGGKCP